MKNTQKHLKYRHIIRRLEKLLNLFKGHTRIPLPGWEWGKIWMDRSGVVLDKIKELGIEDNTYIVIAADNGYRNFFYSALGRTQPLHSGKWWVWQGGIRVSMFAKGPGIEHIGGYYALVTEIDHYVGEILDALEEAGLDNETIVIYTSDHGDFVGNHGMVEKCAYGQNVYQDILNIPLIIRYPGKTESGKRIGELITNADILPTLVDLLDLDIPELKHPFQGESMVDLIMHDQPMDREYIVSEKRAGRRLL